MIGKQAIYRQVYQATLAATAFFGLGALLACNHPPSNDQQLQEQAAKATEAAKQQSAEALAQARVAAGNAERAVNDVAAGVKEGLGHRSAGDPGQVNLNTASEADLAALPGVSSRGAARIIRHRPYASIHDLVKKGVVTESQYEEISSKVTVQ